MNAYYQWLNALVNKNKSDFAEWSEINWLNPYNSEKFEEQRDHLLRKIGKSVLFKDTKPFYRHISEGCRICGSGKWSCLFITGRCNASCFYCPAPQQIDEIPSTQGLNFDDPANYANYINDFGFEGVSFSGGEPLLYFRRTLEYLKEIRSVGNKDIYIWMYTNGLLADRTDFDLLASEGLNEIRFDIGATAYKLDNIKFAKGKIPVITIEIPAIPEEKEKIIQLLPEMVKLGVTNLNLHQLRLTPHNVENLVKKNYTIVGAEKPIVLESELAALEILNYVKEHGINMGVNYCSFFFKHRFQKAGYRKQIARRLASGEAVITQNAYIREITNDSILYKTMRLQNYEAPEQNMHTGNRACTFTYTEEVVFRATGLSEYDKKRINELIEIEPREIPGDPLLFRIWQLEYVERGLREY